MKYLRTLRICSWPRSFEIVESLGDHSQQLYSCEKKEDKFSMRAFGPHFTSPNFFLGRMCPRAHPSGGGMCPRAHRGGGGMCPRAPNPGGHMGHTKRMALI